MNLKQNIFISFFRLFNSLDKKQKLNIYYSIFFMVIASFLEVLSIGALIPFVTAILSPDKLFEIEYLRVNLDQNDFKDYNIQLVFTIIFILSIIFANLIRIYVLYLVNKLSKTISTQISTNIYKTTISSDYKSFKQKNSADIVSLITDKMESISGVFYNFLNAFSSIIISAAIITLLLTINFKITIICIFVSLLIYFFIGYFLKTRLKKNSKVLSIFSISRIKKVRETFGSFKLISLFNAQKIFIDEFNKFENNFRMTQLKIQIANLAPRYFVETLGIVIIALIIYILYAYFNYESVYIITLVGALAYAAQRLLPLFNNIYVCFSALFGYSVLVDEMVEVLNQTKINNQKKIISNNIIIPFKKNIKFKNVKFKYNESQSYVLNNVNSNINKGTKVAVIGKTGVGKSTFIDILMGLLEPTEGHIEIDQNKLSADNLIGWQRKISHVPQEIFLFDSSIKENIAFNHKQLGKIEMDRVIEISKAAEIHEFISKLPEKYDTVVGENGMFLSGGQKQRIGIARALYNEKEILTLDEATSALDRDTERKILNNIIQKNITVIQITHRIDNLDNYDQVIEL
tara:strand:+ start:203 stop:1924 length:1722 start_codon:yes stop_codon:yes gene_type:complete